MKTIRHIIKGFKHFEKLRVGKGIWSIYTFLWFTKFIEFWMKKVRQ